MNLDTLPCGAMAALDEEMRREDRAEQKQARLEAEYPVKEFLPDAWANLQDQTGYEYLQHLIEAHGDQVCRVLMRACDLGFEVNDTPNPELQAMYDQRIIRQHMQAWALDEARRLRDEQIEARS